MIYLDAQVKEEFGKLDPSFLVACSFVDFEAAKLGVQLELIVVGDDGAIFMIDARNKDEQIAVCENANKVIRRIDRKPFAYNFDFQLQYIKCRLTTSKEIESLQ